MGALETMQGRWREVKFDETAIVDPTQTVRATTATRHGRSARSDRPLPHISIDLSGTLSSHARERESPDRERAELELHSLLGEGGMGRVYLAHQRSLDREVAIKTLHERAAPGDREALVDEGAITGFLEHPSIIPVHVLGQHDDGRPVLVMKRVDGVPWRALIRNPSHPAWEPFGGDADDRLPGHLEILMQVCNAAHFAHSRGVVHLDIKPQNVMIGRFGEVYLADWGLAFRLGDGTRELGIVCGTPAYMAPEMALASKVDARTDVYLLGATLHEVLVGQARHVGPTVAAVMLDALASPAYDYPSSVPRDLAAIANRATARDPNERFASAAELRRALADHGRHASSSALVASVGPRLERLRALSSSSDDEGKKEADRLITEVRFALAQAVEQWSENQDAIRASAELDDILASRRARTAALEKLAHDQDPTVSARQRQLVVFGFWVAVASVSALSIARWNTPSTPRHLFITSFGPLLAILFGSLFFRRHLRKNTFNRQSAVSLIVVASSITASRGIGLYAGISTSEMILRDTFVALALAAYVSVLPSFRWVLWIAVVMAGSLVASVVAPVRAEVWFNLATSINLLLAVLVVTRDARKQVSSSEGAAG